MVVESIRRLILFVEDLDFNILDTLYFATLFEQRAGRRVLSEADCEAPFPH